MICWRRGFTFRTQCVWHCMAKTPHRFCGVYVFLVVLRPQISSSVSLSDNQLVLSHSFETTDLVLRISLGWPIGVRALDRLGIHG